MARRKGRLGAQIVRWALVAAVVALGTLVAWRYAHSPAAPLVRYQTATVDHGPVAAKVTASDAVSTIVTVQVCGQVSGRISAWYPDFNAPMKKGQLIATTDPSLFAAAVEQARVN
jgi:HlyD family secretion protein